MEVAKSGPTIPLGMEVSETFIVPVLERLDMV